MPILVCDELQFMDHEMLVGKVLQLVFGMCWYALMGTVLPI